VNTPHPELEELAALVDSDEPGEVGAHVAGCAQCTADLTALRGIRATLRSLPPIQMPDDVAQRLEAAIHDAAAATTTEPADPAEEQPGIGAVSVLPAGGSTRRSARRVSSRGLPNLSVAAAVTVVLVIALGVGLGVGLSHGGATKGSSTSGVAAAPSAGSIVTASGTDYTEAAIRNQVAGLMLAHVPDAHAEYKGLSALAATASSAAAAAPAASVAGGAAATPTASSSAAPSAPAAGGDQQPALQPRSPFSGPLGDPTQLQACVRALLDQPATPVLVDYAYYAGKPATIIVLKDPSDPTTLDVYVEADTADCAKAGDVTFVAFLRDAS
jgi:hypothetical protein